MPQHYLRHFAVKGDSNKIWMYDKEDERFKILPIKNVAQASGFYFEEDESALSGRVEAPALQPLEKLRNGEGVSQDERAKVATYLQSLLSRVPKKRRENQDLLSREFPNMVVRAEERLQPFIQDPSSPPEQVDELARALERWKRYDFEDIPPEFNKEVIQRQWMFPWVVKLLRMMTWRIIESDPQNFFLTSDNPVFYFEWLGFEHPAVEVSVPLSSSVSLHASYQGIPMETLFVQARPSRVKELNRRTVSGADRFIFFHQDAVWVDKIAKKPRLSLNRIVW